MIYQKMLSALIILAVPHYLCGMDSAFKEIEKQINGVVNMLKIHSNEQLGTMQKDDSDLAYHSFKDALKKINDLKCAYETGSFDDSAIVQLKQLGGKAYDLFSAGKPYQLTYGFRRYSFDTVQRITEELKFSEARRAAHKKAVDAQAGLLQGKVLLHNAIVILGSENESSSGPIVSVFHAAILQEAAPIVIHPRLFKGLFEREKNQETTRWVDEKPLRELLQIFNSRWLIYGAYNDFGGTQKWERYLILVPRAYKANLKKEFPALSDEQLLGFDLGNIMFGLEFLRSDNRILSDALREPASITDCFLPKDKDSDKALWNICLFGHGIIETKTRVAQGQTKATDSDLQPLFAQRKQNELFDSRKFRSVIGGLTLREFTEFLHTIQQKITMNFFTYISCFAGGYNLYLPYKARILNEGGAVVSGSIKPNFTIAVGSLTDAFARTDVGAPECLLEVDKIPPGYTNFYKFFERLNLYTKNYLKDKETVRPARLTESELRNIMEPLTDLPKSKELYKRLENMPLVMFPHTDHFVFVSLEPKSTFVLTEAKIKAAELEHKAITMHDMFSELNQDTVHTILMSAIDMPITLNVSYPQKKGECRIVSLLSGIGMHLIKEINAQNIHISFLDLFSGGTGNKFPKYFYIEKVHTHEVICSDDGLSRKRGKPVTLSHVLVGVDDTAVAMFFTDADNRVFIDRGRGFACALNIKVRGSSMEEVVTQYLNGVLDQEHQLLFAPLRKLFSRHMNEKITKKNNIQAKVFKIDLQNLFNAIKGADVERVRDLIPRIPEVMRSETGWLAKVASNEAADRQKYGEEEAEAVDCLMKIITLLHDAGIRENVQHIEQELRMDYVTMQKTPLILESDTEVKKSKDSLKIDTREEIPQTSRTRKMFTPNSCTVLQSSVL